MMSAFFHFQHTLDRLFNNCIKLYWYYVSSACEVFWDLGISQSEIPIPHYCTGFSDILVVFSDSINF